jgi:UDP-2,3-diacylglucosamine pyrophosphatase LpxH
MNFSQEPKTVVIGGDVHYPRQDKKVWQAFLTFITRLKPNLTIINGDTSDLDSISSFDRNPAKCGQLQDELQDFQAAIVAPLRKAVGQKDIIFTEGNHEDRLRRYTWKNASALASLPSLTIPSLYGLDKHKIAYIDGMVECGHLVVLHGHMIRSESGATAKAHFQKHGTSLVVGHCHRLGSHYKTDIRGMHGAWEGGCLCEFKQDFDAYPNWQHGWLVVKVWENGLFNVETVAIVNHDSYVYGGKVVKI